MNQVLLYISLFTAIFAFFLSFIACVRLGKFVNMVKGLDWQQVVQLTGDVASLKRSIQQTNNRLNGQHSPKVADQEILQQLLQAQTKPKPNGSLGG